MKPMKKYQKDATLQLAKLLWEKGIGQDPGKITRADDFLLHAPTGSGKTRICAETMIKIEDKAEEEPFSPKLSFIWFSSSDGKLWEQSMSAIEEVFKSHGSQLDTMTLDDLLAKGMFEEGKCYFIPYNRVRSKTANTARGFGEKETLDTVCAKPSDIKLVAFADEAHKDLGGNNTKELPQLMHVSCLTQVTATPVGQINPARICAVDIDDAITEGMIKREFRIQDLPDAEPHQLTDEYLIEQTVKLQNMKKDVWAETEGVGVPKVLIQIAPDDGNKQKVKTATASPTDIKTAKEIIPVLKRCGVSPEKIYVWLSDDEGKRGQHDGNGEAVDATQFGKPGCDAEYLIFKNAVAHGWDCRDAATLLRLRQKGKISFNIQTFGRIGRSPNPSLAPEQLDHKYLYGADIITNDVHANIEAATAIMFSGKIKDARDESVCRIKEEFKEIASEIVITAQGLSKSVYKPVDPDTLRDRLWDLLSVQMPAWSALRYERILVPEIQARVLSASQLWQLDNKETIDGARPYNPNIDDIESLFLMELAKGKGREASAEIQDVIEEYAESSEFKAIPDDADPITNIYERLMSSSEEFFPALRDSVMTGTLIDGKPFRNDYRIPQFIRTKLEIYPDATNYLYDMAPDWSNPDKNGLDSTQEPKVVKFLLSRDDVLFWFKNGTDNDDFSILYTRDKSVFGKKKGDGKKHRFFLYSREMGTFGGMAELSQVSAMRGWR